MNNKVRFISKILPTILFNILCSCGFSQAVNINKTLDSIINLTILGKPKLIQTTNYVIVDTFSIKKVWLHKKDSCIIVKFSNSSFKKIKAIALWGQVTDFNERRRFFNGQTYTIWRTKAPYIYRVMKNNNAIYYYSEFLTSNIYLLNNKTIDTNVSDSVTKTYLNKYILDNKISDDPTKNLSLKDFIETSVDITGTLFNSLIELLNNEAFFEFAKGFSKNKK